MKIFTSLLVIGLMVGGCKAFMTLTDFKRNILTKCYGWRDMNEELDNGQLLPIPSSIEAFVSLVEKIEELYPTWKPDAIARNFLISFRYDDVQIDQQESGAGWTAQLQTRGGMDVSRAHEILAALFGTPGSISDLRSEDLTDDERCALYFMISHTVNGTARKNDGQDNGPLKHPREQGVVSLSSRTRHALALGKVLLGLLAGLQDTTDISAKDLCRRLNIAPPDDDSLDGVNINILYAATLGDAISLTKAEQLNLGDRGDTYFLPNGYWNEAVCTTRYLLDDNTRRHASLSLLRGGIDGYLLGKNIKQATSKDFKLSQALRMYYSSSGFPEMPQLSWCNRQTFLKGLVDEVSPMAVAYDKLYSVVTGKTFETTALEKQLAPVLKNIIDSTPQLLEEPSREGAECSSADSSRGRSCETPADVIAILDWRSSEQEKQMQNEVVGNLTSGFRTSFPDSLSSVFTNLKPQGGGQLLDTIINGSRCSGCAGCAIRHYQPLRSGSEPEAEVLRDLNRTLTAMHELEEEEAATPAKVVLYFNYGNPQSDSQLRDAIWELERYHRADRILAIGSKKDNLKVFVTDQDRDIETGTSVQIFMPKLKEKVCKVPAQFQFRNCFRRTDGEESNNKFEGFITPSHIQYWSMDPKYFHQSLDIKLTFRALSGQIRVCYSRVYSNIFQQRDPIGDCKDTGSDGTVLFYVSNPCHKRTVRSCAPFYFYVEGKSTPTEICTDKRCKSPNQIQFEFGHEGVSCNSASTLNPAAFVLASLLLIFWRFLFPTK